MKGTVVLFVLKKNRRGISVTSRGVAHLVRLLLAEVWRPIKLQNCSVRAIVDQVRIGERVQIGVFHVS